MSDGPRGGTAALAEAWAEFAAGDYESTVATLSSATVREDEYLDYAYLLGLGYARLRRFDEALLYLEQVVTSGGGEVKESQCRMALALIYSETGRHKLAEYELRKLTGSPMETAQVRAALGHSSWAQGRLEEGLDWYAKALELSPENLNALNGYGYLLACAGRDLELALTCCRKAVDGDPGNPAYADSLGWAYFKLGRLEEASRYLYVAKAELGEADECRAHIEAYEKALFER